MDSVAGRANPLVLLGAAVVCTAAICCLPLVTMAASEGEAAPPRMAPDFPVASDVRLAGDDKRTRFILDLDKTVQFRAFVLPTRIARPAARRREPSDWTPAPARPGGG